MGAFGNWTWSTWKPSTIKRASTMVSMKESNSRYVLISENTPELH